MKGKLEIPMQLFSSSVTLINNRVGYQYIEKENRVYYFNGAMPISFHSKEDKASFKITMVQLYLTGNATQAEINRCFDMDPTNMKRWVKKYKEKGAASFYAKSKKTRKGSKSTPEVLEKAQLLLDEGKSIKEVAKQVKINESTLKYSIKTGKLAVPQKKTLHQMEKVREQ